MENLMRVPIGSLRVLEYPVYFKSVIEIVQKQDLEALKIQAMFILLKEQGLEVDKITVKVGYSNISADLKKIRTEQSRIFGALNTIVEGHRKVQVAVLKDSTDLIIPLFDRFLNRIYRNNSYVKFKKAELLLAEIDHNDELKTAIDTLGFNLLIDQLRTNNEAIYNLQATRIKTKSETGHVFYSGVIARASRTLTKLFDLIEINRLTETNVDFDPLVKELNQLNNGYRQLLTQRKTLARKPKVKK